MSIGAMRQQIDSIDLKIVRLLNKRALEAIKIGREKRKKKLPVRDPRREDTVMTRVRKCSKGPLDGAQMKKIYKQIISACVKAEMEMR
jgi:chorismate mutase/prephenate dehydratase